MMSATQAAPCAAGAPAERRQAACAVGALVLAGLGDDRKAVVIDGARLARPFSPDPGDELAAATVRRQRPSNLFAACPSLVGRMPAGARWATRADIAAASRPLASPLGPRTPATSVVWISAPIFDRGKAYVFVETRCPGLCGGGAVQSFSRAPGAGAWERAGGRLAWTS